MIGGPFVSHTIAGRRFTCDGEDTAQLQVQGKTNELHMNGDGTQRNTQTRVPGTLEGSNIVFDPATGDDDYLNKIRDDGKFVDYSGEANDGTIWAGSIIITGDLKFDYKVGTVPISFAGTFQKQG
jgi:hypothetical protein